MPATRQALLTSIALSIGVVGCSNQASLSADVHTDLVPGAEFDEVLLTTPSATFVHPATSDDWLAGVRVGPATCPDGAQPIGVELRLGGRSVVARNVRTNVHGTTVVPIWLLRACAEVSCPPDGDPAATECVDGHCVRPDCEPGMPGCSVPACTIASECDPATVACVRAACRELHCVLEPVAGVCGAGEWCDPAVGCAPLPTDGGTGFDGGRPDGGPDAPTCTTPCDDDDLCTYDDCMVSGNCVGTEISCEDDECLDRRCNGTSTCTLDPRAGRACTSDGNICTEDECDDTGVCAHVPIDDPPTAGPPTCSVGRCCGGVCVNRAVDLENCGGCGIVCGAGLECTFGDCTCDGGPLCTGAEVCCGQGGCVDLMTDDRNCGVCDRRCVNRMGDCNAGVCACGTEAPCTSGMECCRCTTMPSTCVPVGTCTC